MTNWQLTTFGNICELVRGPFGGSLKKSCFTDSGYAVYEQQHAIQNQFKNIRYFVSEKKFEEMKRFRLSSGDLIMSCSGTMGKVAIVPDKIPVGIINQALLKLTPKKNLSAKFLKYWMDSPNFQDEISRLSKGVAIKNVASVKILKQIQIPIPPLQEQKQIVGILDEAFEGIMIAEANTKKNLANAIELFDSYLNQVFTEKSDRWISGELEKVIGSVSTGPFGSLLHKSDYIENGIPLVNPANIDGSKIIPNIKKTVSPETLERLNNYILFENDIVVGRRGEIGRCAVIGKSQERWLCGTGCFFIRPQENINSIFVAHILRSNKYRGKLELLATGATMKNLSNSALARLIVALPSFAEQQKIVNLLSELQEKTEELESIYQSKLQALAELKQSILQKAFTGQLTT